MNPADEYEPRDDDQTRDESARSADQPVDDWVDLYLTGDLPARRRSRLRSEMFDERERYEQVRRARECHGILDDYCEHLHAGASGSRESLVERVLDELREAPAPGEAAPGSPSWLGASSAPPMRRRSLGMLIGVATIAATVLLAAGGFFLRTIILEDRILARVASVEGQVRLLEATGGGTDLSRGRRLHSGDIIDSAADGSLRLLLSNGDVARLDGEGRYELRRGIGANELHLESGEIAVRGATSDSGLVIHTDAGSVRVQSGPADFIVGYPLGEGSSRVARAPAGLDGTAVPGDATMAGETSVASEVPKVRVEVASGEVSIRPEQGTPMTASGGSYELARSGVTRVDAPPVTADVAVNAPRPDRDEAARTSQPGGDQPIDTARPMAIGSGGISIPVTVAGIEAEIEIIAEEIEALRLLDGKQLSVDEVLRRGWRLVLRRERLAAILGSLTHGRQRDVFIDPLHHASVRRATSTPEKADRFRTRDGVRQVILADLAAAQPLDGDLLLDVLNLYSDPLKEAPVAFTGLAVAVDRSVLPLLEELVLRDDVELQRKQGLLAMRIVSWTTRRSRVPWFHGAVSDMVVKLRTAAPGVVSDEFLTPLVPFLAGEQAARVLATLPLKDEAAASALRHAADSGRSVPSEELTRWIGSSGQETPSDLRRLAVDYLAAEVVSGGRVDYPRNLARNLDDTILSLLGAGDRGAALREAWLLGRVTDHYSRYRAKQSRRVPRQGWDFLDYDSSRRGDAEPRHAFLSGRTARTTGQIGRSLVAEFAKEHLATASRPAIRTMLDFFLLRDREPIGDSRGSRLNFPEEDRLLAEVLSWRNRRGADFDPAAVRDAFLRAFFLPKMMWHQRGWFEYFF